MEKKNQMKCDGEEEILSNLQIARVVGTLHGDTKNQMGHVNENPDAKCTAVIPHQVIVWSADVGDYADLQLTPLYNKEWVFLTRKKKQIKDQSI